MRIWVTFDDGNFAFSPEPARVREGSLVSWRFRALGVPFKVLRWIVYFRNGSPFASPINAFITDTSGVDGQHMGATSAMATNRQGDYKYGVSVVSAEEEKVLGDEYSRLIVTM